MGTFHNSLSVRITLVLGIILVSSLFAGRAEAQTDTAECGNLTINATLWIEKDIMPIQCGVPVNARNITLHVEITDVSSWGVPELHTAVHFRGPTDWGNECVTPAEVGATCSTVQQTEDDPYYYECVDGDVVCVSSYRDAYRIWLNQELSGAVSFNAWFTYDHGEAVEPIYTPTPTSTGPPATATATATGTPPTATATPYNAAPTATRPNFNDPNYGGGIPTAIPTVAFGAYDGMPAPPAAPQSTPYPTLVAVSSSFDLVYSTPSAITYTTSSTGVVSRGEEVLNQAQVTISDVLTMATGLSQTIYTLMVATDSISLTTVPTWYAPYLPRPVAQVGWDFESMGSDLRRRYSLAFWTTRTAQILAIPVKFVKGLIPWAQALGPLGLFLAWLLVMLPIKLLLDMLDFLKNLAVHVFNFLLKIVHILIDLIDVLIPF